MVRQGELALTKNLGRRSHFQTRRIETQWSRSGSRLGSMSPPDISHKGARSPRARRLHNQFRSSVRLCLTMSWNGSLDKIRKGTSVRVHLRQYDLQLCTLAKLGMAMTREQDQMTPRCVMPKIPQHRLKVADPDFTRRTPSVHAHHDVDRTWHRGML